MLGALGGSRIDHALANIGLLALPRARRPARGHPRRDRPDHPAGGPGPRGRGRRGRPWSDASATSSRCFPHGADVSGVTTTGLAYPLDDEALPAGTPRGLSNVIEVRRRHRAPPVAAGCSSSRPLLHSWHEPPERRRPRPRGRPAGCHRHHPPPVRPARPMDDPVSSTRRTTRPAARPRPASSATRTTRSWSAAPTSGGSVRRAPRARPPSGTSSICRSRSWSTTRHEVAEAYGCWVEKEKDGKISWGVARRRS